MHDILDSFAAERNLATYQMVHGDSNRPDVNFFSIFLENDLGGHVS